MSEFVILAILVAVSALPVKSPVTFPVTSPSISDTRTPLENEASVVSTVVPGSLVSSLNIFHLPESLASLKIPVYLSVPDVSYKPYKPISTASLEPLFLASLINGSSTTRFVVSIVVDDPLIVKLPETVKSLNVTSAVESTATEPPVIVIPFPPLKCALTSESLGPV